jgi:hypothetical protein
MTARPERRHAGAKQVRTLQRLAHLMTGTLLVAYVYLPLAPGSPAGTAIRWFGLPVLVLSGMVMWQWPRLRRLARQWGIRL